MMPLLAAMIAGPTLKVGSMAPGLGPVRWIRGRAPASGRVRVVEFWATWCAPCRANFPNLTHVAKRHAGRVDVIGIDVWERRGTSEKGPDFAPSVKDFVARQGGRMGFLVGMDRPDGAVARAWLDASRSQGIPTAFVVDARGRIAWIGNGYATEDAVVAVLAGTKNPEWAVAKARRDREAAQTGFEAAARRGDLRATLALRQRLPADAPLDAAFRLLAAQSPAKARVLAEAAITDSRPGMWTYLELTWALIESGHRSPSDAELAVLLAQEGLRRADPSIESRFACLDYLARAQARKGDFSQAADAEAQALVLLERKSIQDAAEVKEARRRLEGYRQGKDPDAPTPGAATKAP